MARRRIAAPTSPRSRVRATFRRAGARLLWLLDWIPVRLTALSFAIVGDFEDAVHCWRTQAKSWAEQDGGEHAGIVLASGGGALGVVLGGALPVPAGDTEFRPEIGMGEAADAELLPSGVGLVWRALVLWLLADAAAHARVLGTGGRVGKTARLAHRPGHAHALAATSSCSNASRCGAMRPSATASRTAHPGSFR